MISAFGVDHGESVSKGLSLNPTKIANSVRGWFHGPQAQKVANTAKKAEKVTSSNAPSPAATRRHPMGTNVSQAQIGTPTPGGPPKDPTRGIRGDATGTKIGQGLAEGADGSSRKVNSFNRNAGRAYKWAGENPGKAGAIAGGGAAVGVATPYAAYRYNKKRS